MRNSIDKMIDLANVFCSEVELTKDYNKKYLVSIKRVSYRENRLDCMERSICGRGDSVIEACEDFMSNASGKLLFSNDKSYYGENCPEYICI